VRIHGSRVVEQFLAREIGLDPTAVARGHLTGEIRLRMQARGCESLEQYEKLVLGDAQEQQALIDELVVSESWFFRDDQPFRWLGNQVKRELRQGTWPRPLRLISLGCGCGEEPYSMALVLLESGLSEGGFTIDAVDVSSRRIEAARTGVYSRNAFRGVGPNAIPRSFRPHPQGFELDPAIRRLVRFHRASLTDPGLLKGVAPYQVIFCRNVLIYLNHEARGVVEATIARLLDSAGWLVLGHADRLGSVDQPSLFMPVGDAASFTYRKRPLMTVAPPGSLRLDPPVKGAPGQGAPQRVGGDAQPRAADGRNPVCLLDEAERLANRKRHQEALELCKRALKLKGPGSRVYHLMGAIQQAAGDRRQAEESFKRAIYLDPHDEMALLALAALADQRGDRASANRFRRRARDLAKRQSEEGSRA